MYRRALVVWLGLLLIAVGNGLFREAVLIPRLGELSGRQASTVILSLAIFVLALLAIRWVGPRRARDAWRVGGMWLVLTLVFEFGFGRLRGRSWPELLADYDVAAGRIWILVLMVTMMSPWLAWRLRARHGSTSGRP